jgi:hypothetical protein
MQQPKPIPCVDVPRRPEHAIGNRGFSCNVDAATRNALTNS